MGRVRGFTQRRFAHGEKVIIKTRCRVDGESAYADPWNQVHGCAAGQEVSFQDSSSFLFHARVAQIPGILFVTGSLWIIDHFSIIYLRYMRRNSITKNFLSSLGSVVKQRRLELGFSQEELAERSGLHRTYITDIERGVRNITLKSATRLAKALEVSLATVFAKVEGVRAAGDESLMAILLVDDDAEHVELTMNTLKENGVTNPIVIAKTGVEALKLLFGPSKQGKQPIGLILLDLKLSDMSGVDILNKIQSDTRTRSVPVVVLKSSGSEDLHRESMALGIKAFVTKPVYFSEFSTIMPKLGFRWLLTKQT